VDKVRGERALELQREQSAELARRRIREFPNGLYEAEMFLDDAGEVGTSPLRLKVKVLVDGDRMVVTTPIFRLRWQPINSGVTGCAMSTARIAYKILVRADYPTDEDCFTHWS